MNDNNIISSGEEMTAREILFKLLDILTMVLAVIFIAACVVGAAIICFLVILTGNFSVHLDFNYFGEGYVEMAFFVVLFTCFIFRAPHIFRSVFSKYDSWFKP